LRVSHLIIPGLAAFALAGAPAASAAGNSTPPPSTPPSTAPPSTPPPTTGGAGIGAKPAQASTAAEPVVVGFTAQIIRGVAYAPSYAPIQVQRAIWAGNKIRRKPYRFGGGHGKWNDGGYDCSGSVSYVLHAVGLLRTAFDSSDFMRWDQKGLGKWITVYTNPGHAFIEIAGIRFDTSSEGDPNPAPGSGPRWRVPMLSTSGFAARHPAGL
jgi:hypothetical protein